MPDALTGYGLPLPPGGSRTGSGWQPRSPGVVAAALATPQAPPQAPQRVQPQQQIIVRAPQKQAAVQTFTDTTSLMKAVATAGHWQKTVVLRYRKKTDFYRIRVVEVEPYSVRGPYLYAYCLQHGEIHSFLISNIVSVRQTDRKFSPRWTVEF